MYKELKPEIEFCAFNLASTSTSTSTSSSSSVQCTSTSTSSTTASTSTSSIFLFCFTEVIDEYTSIFELNHEYSFEDFYDLILINDESIIYTVY